MATPHPALSAFSKATCAWFEQAFPGPTPVQAQGWPKLAAGENALLLAPTGSGKTLAAFLAAIDGLIQRPRRSGEGVRVLYISPLKALAADIERNLRAPLLGIAAAAQSLGMEVETPTVAMRSGDTSQRDRRRMQTHPSAIVVTTPESLYLMLGSQVGETLRDVETVIIDEIHALAPTKRGAHLALSLERLSRACHREPQRIGLSATARPLDAVARFLGGDRPVAIVDTSQRPHIDLQVVVPVARMDAPHLDDEGKLLKPVVPGSAPTGTVSLWPAVHEALMDAIEAHATTIVFVNSRGLCERLGRALNTLDEGRQLARAGGAESDSETAPPKFVETIATHHGSLSHARRAETEDALKAGELRAIVATSSLELGVDMASVDLVLMVESPGSVASGLQRIGRAGHQVGERSKGLLFPKHRSDLVEATIVAKRMRSGEIEALTLPRNPLDVLAQQVVAMVATAGIDHPTPAPTLLARIQRSANFRDLSRALLDTTLDMLSGRYPSNAFADLRPRLNWDRDTDLLTPRKGAKMVSILSGGTIPDRGLYTVMAQGDSGASRVGELDEEMVHETLPGDIIALGSSSWRVLEITHNQVQVVPAPGEGGRLPFWHGEGPGRPLELGQAMGEFLRRYEALDAADATEWFRDEYGLDRRAASNLHRYLGAQITATHGLPTDRRIIVERFRDALGDWRVSILSPLGARVHAPWALAIRERLGHLTGADVQILWSDDGIALRFANGGAGDGCIRDALDAMVIPPEDLEEEIVAQLGATSLFASQFRENAARALLLPRRTPGSRSPLWQQRLRAKNLLGVARQYPAFPIVLETYRSCLKDHFDVPALTQVMEDLRSGAIKIVSTTTPRPSPFSQSLVFAYTAAYLYDADTPPAERRAQALTLDRELLASLLGEGALRTLLDAGVIADVEAERQCLVETRHARDADGLSDLLRAVGALSEPELALRCEGVWANAGASWLQVLCDARRVVSGTVAGEQRWLVVEDAAAFRDAMSVKLDGRVPDAFHAPHRSPNDALDELVGRYARTHGPFTRAAVAQHFGIDSARATASLERRIAAKTLESGAFQPGGDGEEFCDSERLREIRRRSLKVLRGQVKAVEAPAFARFLPRWHGVGPDAGRGAAVLEDALDRLEGLPLPARDLEDAILPARVRDYRPAMLDTLMAGGGLVWMGHGALGARDGRIVMARRDRLSTLIPAPEPWAGGEGDDSAADALLEHLTTRGASFSSELLNCAPTLSREALEAALWALVWAGLITNDGLGPLRALASGRSKSPPDGGQRSSRHPRNRMRGRRLGRAAPQNIGGRWSLTAPFWAHTPPATERQYERAWLLLERHGVLGRTSLGAEVQAGGFSGLYPILRAMEDQGSIRRGAFVAGLGGAQFSTSGAIKRLRAARKPDAGTTDDPTATDPQAGIVLAATDPANPFGATLPWPEYGVAGQARAPKRAAGVRVVLVDGQPVAVMERGPHLRLARTSSPIARHRAALALAEIAARRTGATLRIERIDGVPARESVHRPLLEDAGFSADHKGLFLAVRRP